jgi:hypothetical protein
VISLSTFYRYQSNLIISFCHKNQHVCLSPTSWHIIKHTFSYLPILPGWQLIYWIADIDKGCVRNFWQYLLTFQPLWIYFPDRLANSEQRKWLARSVVYYTNLCTPPRLNVQFCKWNDLAKHAPLDVKSKCKCNYVYFSIDCKLVIFNRFES